MKQLAMIHNMKNIEDYPLHEDFSVRNYRPGEELIWVEICKNGLFAHDVGYEGWKNEILGRENLVPEKDIFMICNKDDVPVATITGYVRPNGIGDIHMVAAKNEVRGKNVGRAMLSIAMRKLKTEMDGENRLTHLTTDDHRLAAIVGYLKAGFKPVLYDEDMDDRWRGVCNKIGIHGIEMVDEEGKKTGIVL